MKPLSFVLSLAALLAVLVGAMWVLSRSEKHAARPEAATAAPFAAPTSAADPALLEALQRLQMRVDDLAARVDELELEQRRAPGSQAVDFELSAPAAADPGAPVDGLSAQECLRRYVASFEDGSEGDEFYGLAVQAHLDQLLTPVAAIVASPAHVDALRISLAAMLRKPRFGATPRVVDALFGALVERVESGLPAVALESLIAIGGRTVLQRLEQLVWTLADDALRHAALERLVQASPGGVDAGVERLFPMARDDGDRLFLLSLLKGDALPSALATIRAATRFDVPVRIAAALRLGQFHGGDVLALVDWWLGFEAHDDVRAALGASRTSASAIPRWHAQQACGAPDADASRDDPRAWAAMSAQAGMQWLELGYEPALRASGVRIHEGSTAGGLRQVSAFDDSGVEHVLWSGKDPLATPEVLALDFPATKFRVQRLRLLIDTEPRNGWEEIDAVQIVGPDGAAWASSAQASSHFGS
jgi:hypothetical protein